MRDAEAKHGAQVWGVAAAGMQFSTRAWALPRPQGAPPSLQRAVTRAQPQGGPSPP
eukprot:CAMPEP_0115464520 /NCGR_PEP_ID=MMETSP0271-20121206/48917_1 /TAXON_ID=71861 /ORGANISM="Scrippsiella trochoidea, Strain CCMP3099" /LENGTH=55 /DNA_ID=CAMNT_0002891411 /DNA_START=405 /DNA_END=568 /DNA_ORIENTATION=+